MNVFQFAVSTFIIMCGDEFFSVNGCGLMVVVCTHGGFFVGLVGVAGGWVYLSYACDVTLCG